LTAFGLIKPKNVHNMFRHFSRTYCICYKKQQWHFQG